MSLKETIFMLPGPVKMDRRVLEAMTEPYVAHRGPEFSQVIFEIRDLLRYLFQTSGDVALLSGSGTAGLDCAISNLLRKDDKVLNVVNGKFGERLHEISSVYADPTLLEYEWGKPPDLGEIEEKLSRGDFKAITLCHNETSTGMTNPARDIARIGRKHDLLVIFDVITAAGGMEFRPDEWGVDIAVLGSQKCLAAPAGLAALYVSERAQERMLEDRVFYLNLGRHIVEMKENGQTPWTPAIPLVLAFREALRLLKEEGLENRIKRIHKLASAARDAVHSLGLSLFPQKEFASDTVTAIRYPEGISDSDFRRRLKEEYGVILAGGQAHLKGKIFRMGTMGICSMPDILSTFASIESLLRKMGFKCRKGSGTEVFSDYL